MKFKIAVTLSVILHFSLFALALYSPNPSRSSATRYYVDLVNMPGGGSGGNNSVQNDGDAGQPQESVSVRDLTVKKEAPKSKHRYPDKIKKKAKKTRKKKKKEKLVSVVKRKAKKTNNKKPLISTSRRKGSSDSNVLRTGIGTGGSGTGSGGGTGSGTGTGSGIGGGNFPYAYYINTLKNRVSSSWYSSLVSPGLRGKLTVIVYFRIKRNGSISELKLENESGNKALDLSALRAIKSAAPFPPLPNDFTDQYLGVHFEFEWER